MSTGPSHPSDLDRPPRRWAGPGSDAGTNGVSGSASMSPGGVAATLEERGQPRPHPADALLDELEASGVRYALIRDSGGSVGHRDEAVDLLLATDDVPALETCARACGLERAGGDGAPLIYRDDREYPEGGGPTVRVRTEMAYGRHFPWLRPAERTESILRRARPRGGAVRVSAGDELIDLVLRCVIDEGEIAEAHRCRLGLLLEELREDPATAGRAAERVQRELAPALTWDRLVACIACEDWDGLRDRGGALRRRLLEGSRVASYGRWLAHTSRGGGRIGGNGSAGNGVASVAEPRARRPGVRKGLHGVAAPEQISRRQIRGSGLLLAGRGLSTGLKFLAELVIIRYLTTEEYGSWTYALSAVLFLRGLATLGLNRAIVRFLPIHLERDEPKEFFGVIAFVFSSLVMATGTVITAFYLFPEAIARLAGAGPDQRLDVLFIVILLLPVDTLDDFLTGIFAAFSASRTMFVRRCLLAPSLRILVALTLVVFQTDVRLLAYGYLLAGVAGIVYYGKSLVDELRSRGLLQRRWIHQMAVPVRRVLSYTVPVMAADWCAVVLTTVGPLMLGYYSGMNAVALFQVVVPLVTLIRLVSQTFLVLFEPSAARLYARNDLEGLEKLYWRSAMWVAALTFPAFAASFTAAEPLSVLLFGERYRAAGPILSFLAFGAFLESVLGFNVATLRAAGKLRWLIGVNVVAALASVVMHLLLIPSLGALGAGIATGGSWVLAALLKQVALWKGVGVKLLDISYAGPYLTMALGTAVLAVIRVFRPDDALILASAAVIASSLVLAHARLSLSITDTFPELGRRFPALAKVLG